MVEVGLRVSVRFLDFEKRKNAISEEIWNKAREEHAYY